ncbi:MAG: hypothetical protein QOE59_2398 [Actinomycetota bacterium]|nr:hypothetical protein [Actinomycetota bacterium]
MSLIDLSSFNRVVCPQDPAALLATADDGAAAAGPPTSGPTALGPCETGGRDAAVGGPRAAASRPTPPIPPPREGVLAEAGEALAGLVLDGAALAVDTVAAAFWPVEATVFWPLGAAAHAMTIAVYDGQVTGSVSARSRSDDSHTVLRRVRER